LTQALVFVGGIHGAGKTTVSRLLAPALSASHITAGTLIRETAKSETVASGIGNKAVPNIQANQELLLRGLALRRAHIRGPILLDGHFSLMEPDGTVTIVPTAVYAAIEPIAVVLVEADSKIILSRLMQRDGAAPSLSTIRLLTECERANAHLVTTALSIPMFVVRGDIQADEASDIVARQLFPLLHGAP
jgi:adenylate kinase